MNILKAVEESELCRAQRKELHRSTVTLTVGTTPPPGCRDEGLLAQKARGVRGAVRTDGIADHPSEGDVVVR